VFPRACAAPCSPAVLDDPLDLRGVDAHHDLGRVERDPPLRQQVGFLDHPGHEVADVDGVQLRRHDASCEPIQVE